jgi:hypothetical protein
MTVTLRRSRAARASIACWAGPDGLRLLADAVGPDYEPPDKVPGGPDCLTKFLANQMRGEG